MAENKNETMDGDWPNTPEIPYEYND